MVPKSLVWPPSVWFQPTICRHRIVKQMADKCWFVRRNGGLFNSNTGPSHTNKKLQEIYFEAARHWWVVQKMWKRIRDNPTHYCSMWATSTYQLYKETWWTSQNIHQKLAEAAELIDDKSTYYKYSPATYWRMKISSCTGITAYLRKK